MTNTETLGDFQFRPPRDGDERVTDEMFAHGMFHIHLEQMATDHWWLGITDADGRGISLNFCIGEKRVRNEEGRYIKPLVVRGAEY